jgi:thiamine pyrophosphate-dependent acetolactate synthase large subunit-like protein
MTDHHKKLLGETLFGIKTNTILTLASLILCLGTLFNWVVSPIRQVAQRSKLLDQVAVDVNEIKTSGSKPLQAVISVLNRTREDVNEIKAIGSDPMRDRMAKVESVILNSIQPTLNRIEVQQDRIERKIDMHIEGRPYDPRISFDNPPEDSNNPG